MWIEDCHGDTVDVFVIGRSVLTASHAHACNNIRAYPESTLRGRTYVRAMSFSYDATQSITRDLTTRYFNWEGRPRPIRAGLLALDRGRDLHRSGSRALVDCR